MFWSQNIKTIYEVFSHVNDIKLQSLYVDSLFMPPACAANIGGKNMQK